MLGLMQDRPLLISSLVEHAATFHPDTEVVSRLPEGTVHRTNWRGIRDRAKQVAKALVALGVQQGDRIGTLAWNSHRHLSCTTACRAWARCCTRSTRVSFPSRSTTSSTTPKTAC